MMYLRRLDLDRDTERTATSPGVEGNRRLTAALGVVLLVLLAIEGGTIPFLGSLEVVHVVVGLVLIPIVTLKLGSTFYRFVRYYTGDLEYRRAGPPHPVMRVVGPLVIVTTVTLFASGVALAAIGRHSQTLYTVHKLSFFAWFAAMTIHVLGHVLSLPAVAARDWQSTTRLQSSRIRQLAIAVTIVAGIATVIVVYPLLPAWGPG